MYFLFPSLIVSIILFLFHHKFSIIIYLLLFAFINYLYYILIDLLRLFIFREINPQCILALTATANTIDQVSMFLSLYYNILV